MSNYINEALSGFAKFDTYSIQPIGDVHILKPGLEEIQDYETFAQSIGEEDGVGILRTQVNYIGLNFIVDTKGKRIYNKKNIGPLVAAPVEILVDIIAGFKETFEKVSTKMEKLQKKR